MPDLTKDRDSERHNRQFRSRAPVSCSSEIKSKSTIKSKNVEVNPMVAQKNGEACLVHP